jgi:NAD-specific glutamate dehydrogenase
LFTGGIGTYVKVFAETHADVADKADGVVRVDGAQLRVRVVAEGGDLGLTQRGRIARSPPRCWSTKSSTTVASPTPTGWPKSSRSRLPTRVRAYSVAVAVFDLHATWQAIADLSNPVPMSVADDMMLALRRLAVLRVIGVLGHRSDVGPRERAGTRRPLARVGSPGTAR